MQKTYSWVHPEPFFDDCRAITFFDSTTGRLTVPLVQQGKLVVFSVGVREKKFFSKAVISGADVALVSNKQFCCGKKTVVTFYDQFGEVCDFAPTGIVLDGSGCRTFFSGKVQQLFLESEIPVLF